MGEMVDEEYGAAGDELTRRTPVTMREELRLWSFWRRIEEGDGLAVIIRGCWKRKFARGGWGGDEFARGVTVAVTTGDGEGDAPGSIGCTGMLSRE